MALTYSTPPASSSYTGTFVDNDIHGEGARGWGILHMWISNNWEYVDFKQLGNTSYGDCYYNFANYHFKQPLNFKTDP